MFSELQGMLSLSDAAGLIGVHRTTVLRLVRKQALPSVRIGHRYFVPMEGLRAYVLGRTRGPIHFTPQSE